MDTKKAAENKGTSAVDRAKALAEKGKNIKMPKLEGKAKEKAEKAAKELSMSSLKPGDTVKFKDPVWKKEVEGEVAGKIGRTLYIFVSSEKELVGFTKDEAPVFNRTAKGDGVTISAKAQHELEKEEATIEKSREALKTKAKADKAKEGKAKTDKKDEKKAEKKAPLKSSGSSAKAPAPAVEAKRR